jgi:hypothetical protein
VERKCDFNTLAVGVPLTDPSQQMLLENDCFMTVSVADTIDNNVLNIFNSSSIRSGSITDGPDLGAPNKACPGGGPGKGKGGKPNSPFPNCELQGNLLIIQNERISPSIPNDSPYGGTFTFTFTKPVALLGLGIIDIDDEMSVDVNVMMEEGQPSSFSSPDGVGNNGFWKADKTQDFTSFAGVISMNVVFPGSGGISYINIKSCD